MTRRIRFTAAFAVFAIAALAQQDRWQDLIRRGQAAEVAGDYAGAVSVYREASALAEAFDRADARRVYAYNAQGMMYDALGRFADSEMSYRLALSALDHALPGASYNRAVLLANLANVSHEMGQTARAEKLLRESIAMHMTLTPPDEVRTAIARNVLAELLTVARKHDEAAALLESTLAVLSNRPEATTELGIAQNNLGAVRLYQGRNTEAQALFERSLASLESVRGPSHPILLRTLHNLAFARQRNGQRRAAGDLWRRAVDLASATLGLEHPLYGEILGNYAAYLRETGDKRGSKALASRSAEILRGHRRRNGVGGVIDVTALQQRSR
jgi:tetratricopeptide (TPR) repeat protein